MSDATFDQFFEELPIIVTLRGLQAVACAAVADALVRAGVRLLDVPLNVPDPLGCIQAIAQAVAGRALVGATGVYRAEDVDAAADAGARMISAPNTNPDVVARARARDVLAMPGCFTASEAVLALVAGADALRLFPGELVTLESARALAAVLPEGTRLILDGGVTADNIAYWRDPAIHGYVIGASLYEPGLSAEDAGLRAADLVNAYRG